MLDLPCLSCGCRSGLFVVSVTRVFGRRGTSHRSHTFTARLCQSCAESAIRQVEAAKKAPRVRPPKTRRPEANRLTGRTCGGPFRSMRSDARYGSRRCKPRTGAGIELTAAV